MTQEKYYIKLSQKWQTDIYIITLELCKQNI